MACVYLRAMGIVHGCRGMYWPACPLPATLESSRETGEKLSCQCLYCLPDPSTGAGWFRLCIPYCCLVSFAQVCYFCNHCSPTLLPAKQPYTQDTFG